MFFAHVSIEAVQRGGPGQSDRRAKLKKASKAKKPPSFPVAAGNKRRNGSSTQASAGSWAIVLAGAQSLASNLSPGTLVVRCLP